MSKNEFNNGSPLQFPPVWMIVWLEEKASKAIFQSSWKEKNVVKKAIFSKNLFCLKKIFRKLLNNIKVFFRVEGDFELQQVGTISTIHYRYLLQITPPFYSAKLFSQNFPYKLKQNWKKKCASVPFSQGKVRENAKKKIQIWLKK